MRPTEQTVIRNAADCWRASAPGSKKWVYDAHGRASLVEADLLERLDALGWAMRYVDDWRVYYPESHAAWAKASEEAGRSLDPEKWHHEWVKAGKPQ
ncbi:hypothetical protein OG393_29110 [Streptomyces sp. NBC_01216]|uniref:hypothetical protein n=1 Tax=Streptomyces sp. NBC_01216 TaxID=2903778 RepID=UPI002E0D2659|nr:hypothetical protein OG393_29110 [Streptomyces sp. NBC_01216]